MKRIYPLTEKTQYEQLNEKIKEQLKMVVKYCQRNKINRPQVLVILMIDTSKKDEAKWSVFVIKVINYEQYEKYADDDSRYFFYSPLHVICEMFDYECEYTLKLKEEERIEVKELFDSFSQEIATWHKKGD